MTANKSGGTQPVGRDGDGNRRPRSGRPAATSPRRPRQSVPRRAVTELGTLLVGPMACHDKDRHVLTVPIGTDATLLATSNVCDFPFRSRPAGVAVLKPDRFLRDRPAATSELVVSAVEGMSVRLRYLPQSPVESPDCLPRGDSRPSSAPNSSVRRPAVVDTTHAYPPNR